MKNLKSLIIGLLIGALIFGGIPTIAEMISYTAYKADFPILIDGEIKELENPAVTIDGKTYLPLRELGDILNVEVRWSEEKGQVEIGKGGKVVGAEKEYLYTEVDGQEYINIRDVDKIITGKEHMVSWGNSKNGLWFTVLKMSSLDEEISDEERIEQGKLLHSYELVQLEGEDFPSMTRETFETVVLPFINK